MRSILFSFLIVFFGFSLHAAEVDTLKVLSPSMNKEIKTVVVKPNSYNQIDSLPVVYLLHGHGGNHAYWVNRVPEILKWADHYNMIIVCPDGDRNSWYWDSPVTQNRYETFVSQELVQEIDKQFKTIKNRKGRAITGLSMGGHGALYNAIRNQEVFGAAGSMAGGVDIRPFPNNWEMKNQLGSYSDNPEVWYNHSVIGNLHLLSPNSLALFIDCGEDDFFYEVNKELHKQLQYYNIPHVFMSGPGKHDVQYWGKTVLHQFLFFNEFFNSNK